MTTILADYSRRVMVADSNATDGDRAWQMRKVYRIRGALVGTAGNIDEAAFFRAWYANRDDTIAPEFSFANSSALVLDHSGLWLFDENTIELTRVPSGREAIGTGGKGAICAYEAMGWDDPARAVRIACKHDSGSRPPVRTYHLKED